MFMTAVCLGFHKLRFIKGWGNRSFRYLQGPLIIIFRVDATYGCVSLFIKQYMKTRKTISDSAECYAGLSVRFESSATCIYVTC